MADSAETGRGEVGDDERYGPESDEINRRRHRRVRVNREFDVIEDYISEYVTDISQGGVFIRSKNPLSVGTTVTLHFSVIVEDIETLNGEGEVVRVDMSSENMGMGIAFDRLGADSQALIDQIEKRARDGELY